MLFPLHAMAEMYDATGFNFAIADHSEEMPDGVENHQAASRRDGKILNPDQSVSG